MKKIVFIAKMILIVAALYAIIINEIDHAILLALLYLILTVLRKDV